ncbi:MAG: polysaccharide deacetylase family protein [Hyphomicrobiaceae bacterium]
MRAALFAAATAGLLLSVATSGPAAAEDCRGRPNAIGVSRVHEIDTESGPRFGHHQYKETDILQQGEVVLTFDDGPLRRYTLPVLDALLAHCTKATFFPVGRMALFDPDTVKETIRRGHTVGGHTWTHKKLKTLPHQRAIDEIELGFSLVRAAAGGPIAPFFRFPYLSDPKTSIDHLKKRNIAMFSIDADSYDYRTRSPDEVRRTILKQLESKGKGIVLFHDIQPSTAQALASLLDDLKKRKFRVVHLIAKTAVRTDPKYDAMAAQEFAKKKGTRDRPLPKRPGISTAPSAHDRPESAAGPPSKPPASQQAGASRPEDRKSPDPTEPPVAYRPGDDWWVRVFGK